MLETNGVYCRSLYLDVIWKIDEIARRNDEMRKDKEFAQSYMTFQSLFFFANADIEGILFAYPISATGIVMDRDIIAWYPIEDSRPVIASSLKDYLTRWIGGELSI